MRRGLGRRALPGAAGRVRPGARSTCTGTPSPRTSCARRSWPGVGHIVLDSFDDLERLERVAASRLGRRRQEVLIRVTPGRRRATPITRSRPGQADSKFGFAIEEAREAIARLRDRPAARAGRAALPHRLAAARARAVPRGDRTIAGARRLPRLQPRRWARGRVHRRRSSRRRSPSTSTRSSTPRTDGSARTSGCCSSPDARWSRTRPSRCTRSRPSSATSRRGSRSTAGCRTTCGRCSTAPIRGADRRPCPLAAGTERCHAGRQALRVRRRDRPRRAARRPVARRRGRDPGDRRLRLRAGQQLQQRAAAAGDLLPRRRGARLVVRRETYDDLAARDVD